MYVEITENQGKRNE